jgi:hypothetical protein
MANSADREQAAPPTKGYLVVRQLFSDGSAYR